MSDKRGKRSRLAAFDLDKDDSNFVETALNSKARKSAIKRLTSSRRGYTIMVYFFSLMLILSILADYRESFAIGILAFVVCLYTHIDIKIKVLKVFERMETGPENDSVDLE